MSSDDEDYMSDKFLNSVCKEESKSKDFRPGLIHAHSARREHELYKKKERESVQNKSITQKKGAELEEQTRDCALSQPISSSNKGFAMLEKLGFKPGMGLGKSNSGRTEPVPIQLKLGRQGLGRAEALREIKERKEAKQRERLLKKDNLVNIDTYRSRMSEQASERRAAADLWKSQKICMRLDSDLGITEPDEPWFWPDFGKSKEKSEDLDDDAWNADSDDVLRKDNCDDNADETEEEDVPPIEEIKYSVQEKLEMITLYLRRSYCFCIWCGTHFDDERDLQKECPGPTFQDH